MVRAAIEKDRQSFKKAKEAWQHTLSATQLFERLKAAHPSAMRGMTAYSLSRILPQLGERVHTAKGNVYRVVECV